MAAKTASDERALDLLKELVRCRSETPQSANTIEIASRELQAAGFELEELSRGEVRNLLALHGSGDGLVLLCGHLDVVGPGDAEWDSDPFDPVERDGKLYGRGTTDMKGGVAALLTAAIDFVAAQPDHPGQLGVLLTTDEEGPAVDGVAYAVAQMRERDLRFKHGLVGEPSSSERFGDILRVGRRGSLTCRLTVTGKQGHVAYPQLCANPIPVLADLVKEISAWEFKQPDDGTEATMVQVVDMQAGGGASNVIPAQAHATVNFRHHPLDEPDALKKRIEDLAASAALPVTCTCEPGSKPYHTGTGSRIGAAVSAAVAKVVGQPPQPSVGGGTSDGRFLVDVCEEVVEFGSVGRTMHQANEHIEIEQLGQLVAVYRTVLDDLCGP